MSASIELIDRLVGAFEGHLETSQQEHDDAIRCLDLEEIIRVSLRLFDTIGETFARYRHPLPGQNGHASPGSHDAVILAKDTVVLYQRLCMSCKKYEEAIADLRNKGYEVDGAERFLGCIRDAEHTVSRWREEQAKAMKFRAMWMRSAGLSEEEIADQCDPWTNPADLQEEEHNVSAQERLANGLCANEKWAKFAQRIAPHMDESA